MSIAWLFAIVAALSWAGLDAVRKSLARDIRAVALVTLLTVGPAAIFLGWAIFDGDWFSSSAYLGPGLATVAFNVTAYVAFMRAIRIAPLSMTVPMLSLTPVITAAFGAWVLEERLAPRELSGIVLVVVGAVALQTRPLPASPRAWTALLGIVREPGARLMLLTAAAWSAASTLDKVALRHAAVPAHALVQTGGMALLLLTLLFLRGRLSDLSPVCRRPSAYASAIALSVVAIGSQLIAYQLLYVAVVETLKRGVGVIMALVLGRWLFGERIGWQKTVSIAAIVAGTLLTALPPDAAAGH